MNIAGKKLKLSAPIVTICMVIALCMGSAYGAQQSDREVKVAKERSKERDAARVRHALEKGELEAVVELVNGGADVNHMYKNESEMLPLHAAALSGNIEMVTFMLDIGAHVNAQSLGKTPLEYALMNKDNPSCKHAIVEMLIKRGANLKIVDKIQPKHETIIDVMHQCGCSPETREFLEKTLHAKKMQNKRVQALAEACAKGDCEAVEKLLNDGPIDLAAEYNGKTPYEWAKNNGEQSVIDCIQKHCSRVSPELSMLNRGLCKALKDGNSINIRRCIARGAQIGCLNGKLITAWRRLDGNHISLEQVMRNIRILCDEFNIHRAGYYCWDQECLGQLLCNLRGSGSMALAQDFIAKYDLDVSHIFDKSSPDELHRMLMWMPLDRAYENMQFMLENGANVNAEYHGETLLTRALGMIISSEESWQGNFHFARLFLLHKADPNLANSKGLTPLDIALDRSSEEWALDIADILRMYGAGTAQELRDDPACVQERKVHLAQAALAEHDRIEKDLAKQRKEEEQKAEEALNAKLVAAAAYTPLSIEIPNVQISCPQHEKDRALAMACVAGNVDAVKQLLKVRANPNAPVDGVSIQGCAEFGGNELIINALKMGIDII